MQKKEELIKQAFGKSWDLLNHSIQDHILKECEINYEFWRPIKLVGIENNNGWIKIDSVKDIPYINDTTRYKICIDGKIVGKIIPKVFYISDLRKSCYTDSGLSHYKIYVPDPEPLY